MGQVVNQSGPIPVVLSPELREEVRGLGRGQSEQKVDEDIWSVFHIKLYEDR